MGRSRRCPLAAVLTLPPSSVCRPLPSRPPRAAEDQSEEEDGDGEESVSSASSSSAGGGGGERTLRVRTGLLDEKASAVQALGAYAAACGPAAAPFLDTILATLSTAADYWHEEARAPPAASPLLRLPAPRCGEIPTPLARPLLAPILALAPPILLNNSPKPPKNPKNP